MLQIIDSFTVTAEFLAGDPQHSDLYDGRPGVVAIPDPDQDSTLDFPAGTPMRLHRPDGSSVLLTLTAALRPQRTLGLFFAGLTSADIPRLSEIEALSPATAHA